MQIPGGRRCAVLTMALACAQLTGCATGRIAPAMRLRHDEPLTVGSLPAGEPSQDMFLRTVSELKSKARRASVPAGTARADSICRRADLLVASEDKRINRNTVRGLLTGLGIGIAAGCLNYARAASDPDDNEGWGALFAAIIEGPLIVIGSGLAGSIIGAKSSGHISRSSGEGLRLLIQDHNGTVGMIVAPARPVTIQPFPGGDPDTAAIVQAAMEVKASAAWLADTVQRRRLEIGSDSVLAAVRGNASAIDDETLDALFGAAVGAALTAGAIALGNHDIKSIGHGRNALAVGCGAGIGGVANVWRMEGRREHDVIKREQRRLNSLIDQYNQAAQSQPHPAAAADSLN